MKSQHIPPNEETASTISSASCSATTAAIAPTSLTVPAGVSQCTTLTTVISGRRRKASATLAAGTALSLGTSISMTSRAYRRAQSP